MNWEKTIFLAHASEDKTAVRKLYRELKASGLDPWLDEENLNPGVLWDEEIKEVIHKTRFFLACISKHSASKTGYIQKELRMALAELELKPPGQIFFIPVLLEDTELPSIPVGTFNLREFQAVKIFLEGGVQKLITQLKRQLDIRDEEVKHKENEFKVVKDLISQGRIDEALNLLYESKSKYPDDFANDIIFIRSRYNTLLREYSNARITFDDYSRGNNQITFAIMESIKRIEEYIKTKQFT